MSKSWPVVALIISLGLVASTWLFGQAARDVMRTHNGDRTISATGSAKRRIRSDFVDWCAAVHARGPTLAEAYDRLATASPKVRDWLLRRGVARADVAVNAVSTRTIHPTNQQGEEIADQISLYELTQSVCVRSRDVDRVTGIARDVTELIREGVEVESGEAMYIYTRLPELKIALLSEAARDARVRAQKIAEASHARLDALASGRMGVMQVTPANVSETSGYGLNDTTSIEKDALAIVSVVYYTE